jgi:hypothetical protein
MALALDVWFFCQFLTAKAYPGLPFGTISDDVVVFLAPDLALETGCLACALAGV